ncbi:hypothetical protein [Cyanobium sp. ATX 6F1]|uniref:hypothetical protein n=1 Tax=unclassified Cyanobium TaxID=2627006 RepID=UPI0020CEAF54|nr:hypothetical protein [Cyanobium sp. ATX 6F1]
MAAAWLAGDHSRGSDADSTLPLADRTLSWIRPRLFETVHPALPVRMAERNPASHTLAALVVAIGHFL